MAKLYFYYSTMNAGKSTALLQASHNYGERGMRTLVCRGSEKFCGVFISQQKSNLWGKSRAH